MAKRQLDEDDNNYSNIMINLNNFSELVRQSNVLNFGEISSQINEINENVPRLVVCGDQSCGKSTCLNRMFNLTGTHELKTGSNLTTLCPLEIRLSPIYDETKVFINNLKDGSVEYFNNIVEAQDHVKQKYNSVMDCIIVMEINGSESMTIIDIPGCARNLHEYNKAVANYYFNKPNTIVFHIIRADIDPDTEMAFGHLGNIKGTIVKVLTHLDKCDDKDFILKHVNGTTNKVAIINIKSNETDVNNSICKKLGIRNDQIINGIDQLRDYSVGILKEKMENVIPKMRELMTKLSLQVTNIFENIGYSSPDPRDVCYVFKTEMSNLLKIKLSHNMELEKQLVKLKEIISFKEIFNVKNKIIPSIEEIKEELMYSNRSSRTIKGTESCDHVVRKYVGKIISETKNILTSYVNNYFRIVLNCIKNIINNSNIRYEEYVKKYLKKIIIFSETEKQNIVKILIEEINNELDEVENFADTEDVSIVNDTNREYVRQILECGFKYIPEFQQRKVSFDTIVDHVSKQNIIDANCSSAKKICNLIDKYWKLKSKHICDRITEKIAKYEKDLEKKIDREILKIESIDIEEPKDLKEKRNTLIKMKDICDVVTSEGSLKKVRR